MMFFINSIYMNFRTAKQLLNNIDNKLSGNFMNVIEEAMKLNVLIEQDAAKKITALTESQKALFLETIKQERPLIINSEYLDKSLIKSDVQPQKQKYSIHEFVSMLNEYFDEAKKLFLGLSPVSIRNCSENATVIGMVGKIAEEGGSVKIDIEDPTGSILVLCKAEEAKGIKEDDVIAAEGYAKNGVLNAEKIFQAPMAVLKEKFPILFKK